MQFDHEKMLAESPFILWAVDRQGIVTTMTGGLFAGSGVDPQQYVGMSVEQIAAAQKNPQLADLARRALAGEKSTVTIPSNGRILEMRYSPYREDGQIVGAFGFASDITECRLAQEDHEMLASLVTNSADAIIGKTLTGIVVSWNKAAERMYGYTEAEAVGKNIADLIVPPDKTVEFTMIMNTVKKGEVLPAMVTERLRKDGSRIFVSITVSPLRNSAGEVNGASAVARDVTQQWWLERENEAVIYIGSAFQGGGEINDILKLIPPMLASSFHLRIVTIELYDPATQDMILVASHGLGMQNEHHPTRIPLELSACGRPIKTGEPLVETEKVTQLHFSTPAPVTIDAKMCLCVPIIVDGRPYGAITVASPRRTEVEKTFVRTMNLIGGVIGQHVSRNRIEANLAASEDRLRAVVDNTSDMILLASPTGVVTFASQAVTRILGYTPAEFVAKSGYDYIHPDDIAKSQQVHAALLQTDQMQEAVIRLRRTDGTYARMQLRLRSVHGADGGVREIVVAARHMEDESASAQPAA